MSTMEDQPAPQNTPQGLTGEQLGALVQQAANMVTQQMALNSRMRKVNITDVDKRLEELTKMVELMHVHIDVLTKLLISKNTCTVDEVNQWLVAGFATHANELAGKPEIVIPRH
jgi:hypothetical protein